MLVPLEITLLTCEGQKINRNQTHHVFESKFLTG